jgi:hypothetical protein
MSQLRDPDGTLLIVAPHHRRWCELVASAKRLVLLAPRTHGKSYLGLVYVLWRFYRHGRDPLTGTPLTAPTGLRRTRAGSSCPPARATACSRSR